MFINIILPLALGWVALSVLWLLVDWLQEIHSRGK